MGLPNGSFEAVSSISGNPMAPYCGYMENVRYHSLHHASTPHLLLFLAGSGKSVLWFAPPSTLSTLVKLTVLFQFLNYTRYHSLTRCWEGLAGLFLFRFQRRQ
jgi:hypothetical protein